MQKDTAKLPGSVSKFISQLEFPPNIQLKAKEIYTWLDLANTPRQSHRSKCICYCINQAYVELDMIGPDPCAVGLKLGLSAQQSNCCVNTPPKFKKGIVSKPPIIDPVEFMCSYVTNYLFLPEDVVDTMKLVFTKVLNNHPILLQEQLKPLVAVYVLCYGESNGMSINKAYIASHFYLKLATVLLRKDKMIYALATV